MAKELSQDVLAKNYSTYFKCLSAKIGEETANRIIESVGGAEVVMNASYSNLSETGSAYRGSFIRSIIRLIKYALKVNEVFPENLQADADSIYKVCLLSQIAKVLLYIENDNNWEISNRGITYKYNNNLEGALRIGERSTLIAMSAGVALSPIEYEAMNILDRLEDDNYKKYYASPLSTVIRQASEILAIANKG